MVNREGIPPTGRELCLTRIRTQRQLMALRGSHMASALGWFQGSRGWLSFRPLGPTTGIPRPYEQLAKRPDVRPSASFQAGLTVPRATVEVITMPVRSSCHTAPFAVRRNV